MSKKQSLNVTEYLSGLTKDNVDEIAITLERTPAMILQSVNILENWNSKMKNLCSSIFEVFTIIVLYYVYLCISTDIIIWNLYYYFLAIIVK